MFDKLVLVGNSGQASNHKGYLWLKNYLKNFGYTVKEILLDNRVLYLDCALSLVKEGLMIVSEDELLDGMIDEFKDWDKISVPFKDVEKLAINGLPINESVYIMDPEFDYIANELMKNV